MFLIKPRTCTKISWTLRALRACSDTHTRRVAQEIASPPLRHALVGVVGGKEEDAGRTRSVKHRSLRRR